MQWRPLVNSLANMPLLSMVLFVNVLCGPVFSIRQLPRALVSRVNDNSIMSSLVVTVSSIYVNDLLDVKRDWQLL